MLADENDRHRRALLDPIDQLLRRKTRSVERIAKRGGKSPIDGQPMKRVKPIHPFLAKLNRCKPASFLCEAMRVSLGGESRNHDEAMTDARDVDVARESELAGEEACGVTGRLLADSQHRNRRRRLPLP